MQYIGITSSQKRIYKLQALIVSYMRVKSIRLLLKDLSFIIVLSFYLNRLSTFIWIMYLRYQDHVPALSVSSIALFSLDFLHLLIFVRKIAYPLLPELHVFLSFPE